MVGDGGLAAAQVLPADDDADLSVAGQLLKGDKVDVGGAVRRGRLADRDPLAVLLVEDVDPGGLPLGGALIKDHRLLHAVSVDVEKDIGRTVFAVLRIAVFDLAVPRNAGQRVADLRLFLGEHRRAHQILDGGLHPRAAARQKGSIIAAPMVSACASRQAL